MFCSMSALIDANEANIAYPSSAAPRPYSLSFFMTGFQGDSPGLQPSISGCLSRWPYIKILPSNVPGISKRIRGVLPGFLCVMILELSGLCLFAQVTARSNASYM